MKVIYLASLRESMGMSKEDIAPPGDITTVAKLVDWLRTRGEPWSVELAPARRWRVAVNHDVAAPDTAIRTGDEIAFFPPVTGG